MKINLPNHRKTLRHEPHSSGLWYEQARLYCHLTGFRTSFRIKHIDVNQLERRIANTVKKLIQAP